MAANVPSKFPLFASVFLLGATLVIPSEPAEAARGGARASGQTSVNRPAASTNRQATNTASRGGGTTRTSTTSTSSSRSVNRSISTSSSTNIDIDVDNGCCDNDWGDGDLDDNPLARAAIVTGTVVAIGTIVRQPPANCVPVAYQDITYQQCGSTWYQPQYSGTNVQYVVVSPPY